MPGSLQAGIQGVPHGFLCAFMGFFVCSELGREAGQHGFKVLQFRTGRMVASYHKRKSPKTGRNGGNLHCNMGRPNNIVQPGFRNSVTLLGVAPIAGAMACPDCLGVDSRQITAFQFRNLRFRVIWLITGVLSSLGLSLLRSSDWLL